VNNDYLTQTVTIQIPCDSKDYFDDYSVRGSSNHIDEISYYLEGETGTIRLGLDQVCELQQQYRDGILYLEFIDPHDIYDKIVVVDAGHGSRAVGASKLGINEKDINLAIVLQLKQIFENSDENIGVYYTRTDDSNPTLDQRVQLANQVQADLFISVHNNASNNGHFSSTNGTVVMYSESDDSELSSKQLAQICLDQVTETLQSTKVGLLKGDKIYIIRTSEVPVALIEVGFMTNREELANLNTPEYQQIAAQGIYNAILKAFEEGY
jgi:N-acetylmuramoyl-L-alanine amidase